MKNYKFLTSRGWVGITVGDEVDKTYFVQPKKADGTFDHRAKAVPTVFKEFEFKGRRYGGEHIDDMYDGGIGSITRGAEDRLFVSIALSDEYYGSPEYVLEEDDQE
jgi:hypothetical protein